MGSITRDSHACDEVAVAQQGRPLQSRTSHHAKVALDHDCLFTPEDVFNGAAMPEETAIGVLYDYHNFIFAAEVPDSGREPVKLVSLCHPFCITWAKAWEPFRALH